jgi:hypothetical protein
MSTHLGISALSALMLLLPFNVRAEEPSILTSREHNLKINLGTDLVSRYIWRGTDFGGSPCIQPTLSLSGSNFEIGYWSALSTNNSYKEIDLYLKYTFRNVSLTVTDYYVPELNGLPVSPDPRYFVFADKNTAHTLETSLQWKGGEKFPLWISGNVFLYGNDKRWGYEAEKDSSATTYYSTYFEAGYTLTILDNHVDLFAGFTPWAGAFGSAPGFVNLGLTAYRTIRITDSFSLPVRGSLIFNPDASEAFFVFGITI